jgi:F420-dependent oxidoreductase-like protein
MRVCLMIEGQEDVTWADWVALARAADEAGLDALFRSDHYLSVSRGRDLGSLDAWTTLAGLAALTERIRLGTLVSPVTFRHPSLLAKAVTTVDHISGGRAEVGLGAGWFDGEHHAYGFEFPPMGERMDLLAEHLEIVHRHWSDDAGDLDTVHFHLAGVDAHPKPVQQPHPTVIVGGIGGKRSLALAAQWADEYNTVYLSPERCAELRSRLSDACEGVGRDPETLPLSLMTGCAVGADDGEARQRAEAAMQASGGTGSVDEWMANVRGEWVVGTVDDARARLQELEAAGVARVMLQHHAHRDVDMVRLIGAELAR